MRICSELLGEPVSVKQRDESGWGYVMGIF